MSAADPQRGNPTGVYPPPAPPCVCGQIAAVHEVKNGVRRRATAGGPAGPVACTGYQPSLPLWIGYFAATGQWPFVPLMAVYSVGYVRLLRHATRQAVAAQDGAR